MIIESSPNNLDLRQGTDAQSERIGGLVFDALARKDEHFNLQPWLATRWERPDPLTWVFHLRDGVRFQDGRPLEAADVAYTIRSMIDGTLVTAKGGAFAAVRRIETPDRLTVVLHLKVPDAAVLFNLSDGLFGVVPRGSGRDFGLHPIGSGPFRVVSQTQDKEVVVERNPNYWAGAPKIARLRFAVVPDTITSALELQKGSADIASNVLTYDMLHALERDPGLRIEGAPGSVVIYMNFNVQDPALQNVLVRRAISCALDRRAIVQALWRGHAQLASTLLPKTHWAAAGTADGVASCGYDPAQATRLLDQAGLPPDKNGVRLHLTMKISTDETTRLMAAVMQQQMRTVGIDLGIRSAEFGTFYSDITHGMFQIYVLRWIGANEDPDIFRYAYSSKAMPPKGGNRGHYSDPRVDALLQAAAGETDHAKERSEIVEVQRILAQQLPSIPLWYPDSEVIHTTRITGVHADASGTFNFLRTAEVR
jgi:peptide/nickel transport system substrate-binding protein